MQPPRPSYADYKPVSLVKKTDQSSKSLQRNTARFITFFRQDGLFLLRLIPLINILSGISVVALVVLLLSFSSAGIRVFPTTSYGSLVSAPPVEVDVGDNVVSLWVVTAVYKILTMGFHDYQMRIDNSRVFFSDAGWSSYMSYLNLSVGRATSTMAFLQEDYATILPTLAAPPYILQKGLVGGVYTYTVRARVELALGGGIKESNSRSQVVDLTIERTVDPASIGGLVISKWRADRLVK